MHEMLQMFCDTIPARPHATDDFKRGLRVLSKPDALKKRYIQYQIKDKVTGWLVFDIDRPGAALSAVDNNLPEPSIITCNARNGHAHLLYKLRSPIPTSNKSRIAPQNYLKALKQAFQRRLGADTGYAELITKNPISEGWRVQAFSHEYDLSELAEWVDLPKISRFEASNDLAGAGRNCTTFDSVRKLAYRAVKSHLTFNSFLKEIEYLVGDANSRFDEPLPAAEVRSTIKSNANWTWQNKNDIGNGDLVSPT